MLDNDYTLAHVYNSILTGACSIPKEAYNIGHDQELSRGFQHLWFTLVPKKTKKKIQLKIFSFVYKGFTYY